MAFEWYTLRVKSHKERFVREQLVGLPELDVYLPMVKIKPVNPRSSHYRPYFPGYMFVYSDLDKLGLNHLNWTPGTRGLVSFDGIPSTVPAELIKQLQQRLERLEIEGEGALKQLQQGDKIRITSGPFKGYDAIFDMRLPGKDRVQVLLAFLSSHLKRVKLDTTHIEKV